MKASEILKADFLDLLFDNRNKSYGAYKLRKTYYKRLWIALGVAVLLAYSVAWLIQPAATAKVGPKKMNVREVVLQHFEAVKPPPPPKAEEAPAPEKAVKTTAAQSKVVVPKVKRTKYTPPNIVADKEVKKTEVPPVDEIARVDVIDMAGIDDNDLAIPATPVPVAPITQIGVKDGKGILQLPKKKVYDNNEIFEKVEIHAQVDQQKWRQHLIRELGRYIEEAAYEGMPAGQYTVRVRFLVEKDGSISQVKALNNPGYGLAKGAEQVVKSGPKWTAGVQNGHKVRSYQTQPITFVIMEL